MLEILYQDDFLVAIHKPAGLLVHRSELDRHETRFAVQLLRDQIGRHVFPVHRLDRGTSGLLLFALDGDMAQRTATCFASGAARKSYLALVRGYAPEWGEIDHPLSRIDDAPQARGLPRSGDRPAQALSEQAARTRFQRLATWELPVSVDGRHPTSRYALLALWPETGRRHQLRRHLKHIAHPIIGDVRYGKGPHNRLFRERYGSQRLLLASVSLALPHPVSGAPLCIDAPLAEDFATLLTRLPAANGDNGDWQPDDLIAHPGQYLRHRDTPGEPATGFVTGGSLE